MANKPIKNYKQFLRFYVLKPMSLMRFEVDNWQEVMNIIINCGENVSRVGKHLRFYLMGKTNRLGCHSSWIPRSETKDFITHSTNNS